MLASRDAVTCPRFFEPKSRCTSTGSLGMIKMEKFAAIWVVLVALGMSACAEEKILLPKPSLEQQLFEIMSSDVEHIDYDVLISILGRHGVPTMHMSEIVSQCIKEADVPSGGLEIIEVRDRKNLVLLLSREQRRVEYCVYDLQQD